MQPRSPTANPPDRVRQDTIGSREDREAKGRGHHELRQKPFAFVSPDGEIVSGIGLVKFCAERGLSQPHMTDVMQGKRRHYKGWTKYG